MPKIQFTDGNEQFSNKTFIRQVLIAMWGHRRRSLFLTRSVCEGAVRINAIPEGP